MANKNNKNKVDTNKKVQETTTEETTVQETTTEETTVQETSTEETTVQETTTEENVPRETSVHGTTNNIGQEIGQQLPSADVIKCTMTDEEHEARKTRIHEKMQQGLSISWDIMVDITSAWSRNEQELDGYTSSSEDFLKWANEQFGMKDTQVKQARRVLEFYGKIDDKGEYTLEDKYKRYTKEKLDIIQRLPQLKTKAQFDDVTEALGIVPSTSEGVLKDIVRQAKGLPAPQPKDNKKDGKKSGTPDDTQPSVESIKSSDTYKKVESKQALVMKLCSDTFIACNDLLNHVNSLKEGEVDENVPVKAMSIIATYVEAFKEMEKAYNEIGKPQQTEAQETEVQETEAQQ